MSSPSTTTAASGGGRRSNTTTKNPRGAARVTRTTRRTIERQQQAALLRESGGGGRLRGHSSSTFPGTGTTSGSGGGGGGGHSSPTGGTDPSSSFVSRRRSSSGSSLRHTKPSRKWIEVRRPPASGVGFVVSVWVPVDQLTESERATHLPAPPPPPPPPLLAPLTTADTTTTDQRTDAASAQGGILPPAATDPVPTVPMASPMEVEGHGSGQASNTTDLGGGSKEGEPIAVDGNIIVSTTGFDDDNNTAADSLLSPNERPRKRARFEDPADVPPDHGAPTPGGGVTGDPPPAATATANDSASAIDSAAASASLSASASPSASASAASAASASEADEHAFAAPRHPLTSSSVDRDAPTAPSATEDKRPSTDSRVDGLDGSHTDPVTSAAAGDELDAGENVTATAATAEAQKRDWEETRPTPLDDAAAVMVAEQDTSEEDPHGTEPPPAKRPRLDPEAAAAEGSEVGGAVVGGERSTVPPAQPQSEFDSGPPPVTGISDLPLN